MEKRLVTDFYEALKSFENWYQNESMCGGMQTTDFYSHVLWKHAF